MGNEDQGKQNNHGLRFRTIITVIWAALFVPALPTLLYMLGYLRNMGYLKAFGIDPEYYPRSIEYYFVQFFFEVFETALGAMKVFVEMFFICVGFGALYIVAAVFFHWIDRKNKLDEKKEPGQVANYLDNLMRSQKELFFFAAAFLLIPAVVVVFSLVTVGIASPYMDGKKAAEKDMAEFNQCIKDNEKSKKKSICSGTSIVKLNSGGVIQGLKVTSSESRISIYDGTKTVTVRLEDTKLVEDVWEREPKKEKETKQGAS